MKRQPQLPSRKPKTSNRYTPTSSISIDTKPLFKDELSRQARVGGNRRTASYTTLEDEMLCDAWLEIGQDATTRAKKKGTAFWNQIWKYFHEYRHFDENPFKSDRNENSLTKRWETINKQCFKCCASYEHVKGRPVSGVGVQDLVCSLNRFRIQRSNRECGQIASIMICFYFPYF